MHLKTRVEFLSKAIPTVLKELSFWATFPCFKISQMSSQDHPKSIQRFSGIFAFTFPTILVPENQLGEKAVNTVATKGSCCLFSSVVLLLKLNCMTLIPNVDFVRVKTKKALFELLEVRPHCFKL